MREPSIIAIFAGGLIVLVAQLAVWLTPARNLLTGTPEGRPYLELSTSRPATDTATPVQIEESSAAAPKAPVQTAAAPEQETDSTRSMPAADEANVQVAHVPSEHMMEPEIESNEATESATETEVETTELNSPAAVGPIAQMKSGMAPANAEQVPIAAGAAAMKGAVPEDVFIEDAVRSRLNQPVLRAGSHDEDLAALETFYASYDGPARWVTSAGLTPKAQAIVAEITRADDWGLDASDFPVPPPDFQATSPEDQATVEIAIDTAILKYARAAQGGRTDPKALNALFAHEPRESNPGRILSETFAATDADAYLRSLHPKHPQFESLRQALLKASAEDGAKAEDIKRLLVNMERWRWMPADLGDDHVWLNIPKFTMDVVNDGEIVQSLDVVVGSPKTPTPVLSTKLEAIVLNPHQVVSKAAIHKTVLPVLKKQQGWFGRNSEEVLRKFQLNVMRAGKPIDPSKVDWNKVNFADYTFVKIPNASNQKRRVQFHLPNSRKVDIQPATNPSQLKQSIRAVGPSSPRIESPSAFARELLTMDKGWETAMIGKLMAESIDKSIKLDEPVPVHFSYFTAFADDEGNIQTYPDIYQLDSTLEAAIIGRTESGPITLSPMPIPPRKPAKFGSLVTRTQ